LAAVSKTNKYEDMIRDKVKLMSSADKLRNYMKILEGELIPHRENTIRVDLSDYDTVRMLIHLSDEDHEPNPQYRWNQYSRIMTFWDSVSYLKIKRRLDKLGIKYDHEEPRATNFRDNELTKETEHSMSPYPSNVRIQQHNTDEQERPSTDAKSTRKRRKKIKVSKK